jgi:hypothetical protein
MRKIPTVRSAASFTSSTATSISVWRGRNPSSTEVSEGDRTQGRRHDLTAPKPTEQAITAAYQALHDAVRKSNRKGLLAAQGFDAKRIAASRGLEGLEADFMMYADRFLAPGAGDEVAVRRGTG